MRHLQITKKKKRGIVMGTYNNGGVFQIGLEAVSNGIA